ncbi:hypothetical protein AK812_SmicGene24449 [Symbiodinium microadriaticum]|uniref:Uncharacterized protein n=1 Tax=Symbiodinium microadriaticum TaxID=2951 RepID=A0A1Q9DEY1_SYMMI|nr:hypothetical protein AK812_SmicGene24449 [Symbiodinium microadriaticum]
MFRWAANMRPPERAQIENTTSRPLRHKCLMSRGHSSFERVFPRSGTESAPVQPSGDAPSVHELFAMALREELPLPELAEALSRLHGIRMTVAAIRTSRDSVNSLLLWHKTEAT